MGDNVSSTTEESIRHEVLSRVVNELPDASTGVRGTARSARGKIRRQFDPSCDPDMPDKVVLDDLSGTYEEVAAITSRPPAGVANYHSGHATPEMLTHNVDDELTVNAGPLVGVNPRLLPAALQLAEHNSGAWRAYELQTFTRVFPEGHPLAGERFFIRPTRKTVNKFVNDAISIGFSRQTMEEAIKFFERAGYYN